MDSKLGYDAKHLEVLDKSDLGEFQRLYKRFGIEPIVNVQYDNERFLGYEVTMTPRTGSGHSGKDTLSDKIDGYGGFYVRHIFDQNGKFLELGIWE